MPKHEHPTDVAKRLPSHQDDFINSPSFTTRMPSTTPEFAFSFTVSSCFQPAYPTANIGICFGGSPNMWSPGA